MPNWAVVCVTGLTSDTPCPSLLAVFDNKRYLFNAGEAVARALIENNVGWKKLVDVFVTRADLAAAGGLAGICLSSSGAGASNVNVYGPENTEHLFACSRYAFRRAVTSVKTRLALDENEPVFKDDNITVYAYSSQSSRPAKRKRSSSPSLLDRIASPSVSNLTGPAADQWRRDVIQDMFPGPSGRRKLVWPSPAWNHRALPEPRTRNNAALSYLVIGPAMRGKFLPEEAKARGIKKGPDFSKLTSGQSVQAPDGTMVRPEDVMLPGTPPAGFVLFDLPDKAALTQAIESARKMRAQVTDKRDGGEIKMVYYWLGPDLVFEPAFAELAQSFGADVKHITAAPETSANPISNSLHALLQLRLARLDKKIFAMPKHDLEAVFQLPAIEGAVPWTACHREVLRGSPEFCEQMVPPRRLNFTIPSPESEQAESQLTGKLSTPNAKERYQRAARAWSNYVELSQEAVQELNGATAPPSRPGDDVLVTPLGTGSAAASMYRNVSSTLVQIPGRGSLLLDCGEATLGQLFRRFGRIGAEDVLRSLQFIFISHMHADHHAGLATLLAYRHRMLGSTSTLTISCPAALQISLKDVSAIDDLGLSGLDIVTNAPKPFDHAGLNLRAILPIEVQHRAPHSYGIAITSHDGWKIVYSGDTLPCQGLVRHGQDASLLIHEATMEDDRADMAEEKAHSTFGQALDIATRMRARNVLLTHFSQRYPKLPRMADTLAENELNVALAFDLMTIRIGDHWRFRYFLPAMKELFSELTLPGSGQDDVKDEEDGVVEGDD